MRKFSKDVRSSALWGRGSSGIRHRARTALATALALLALAVPGTALADATTDAFLADVYAGTTTTDTSTSDVSWSDVSWSDSVSWSD